MAEPPRAYHLDAAVPISVHGEVALRNIVDRVTGARTLLTAIS